MTAAARIRKRFAELRAGGELGIVAYIIAGDPTLDLGFPPGSWLVRKPGKVRVSTHFGGNVVSQEL